MNNLDGITRAQSYCTELWYRSLKRRRAARNVSIATPKVEDHYYLRFASIVVSSKLPIRRGVGGSGQSFRKQSAQFASLQLPLLLWSIIGSFRSPLLFPSPPSLPPFAFLFRPAFQVPLNSTPTALVFLSLPRDFTFSDLPFLFFLFVILSGLRIYVSKDLRLAIFLIFLAQKDLHRSFCDDLRASKFDFHSH